MLVIAAKELRSPVIFDPRELPSAGNLALLDLVTLQRTKDDIRSRLQKLGWRVLEQRFPRKACVLIRSSEPLQADETLQEFKLYVPPRQPTLWDGLDPPARAEESNWGRDREYR